MADMASSSLKPTSLLYSNRFFGWAPDFPTNNCFWVFFPQFPLRAEVMRVISGSGLLAEYGCNGRSWSNCFGPRDEN